MPANNASATRRTFGFTPPCRALACKTSLPSASRSPVLGTLALAQGDGKSCQLELSQCAYVFDTGQTAPPAADLGEDPRRGSVFDVGAVIAGTANREETKGARTNRRSVVPSALPPACSSASPV